MRQNIKKNEFKKSGHSHFISDTLAVPENNTKAWLSPLGEEIIFNRNDVSWKDLAVFKGFKENQDIQHDLIIERGFSIAPLNQNPKGFKTKFFDELNGNVRQSEMNNIFIF